MVTVGIFVLFFDLKENVSYFCAINFKILILKLLS